MKPMAFFSRNLDSEEESKAEMIALLQHLEEISSELRASREQRANFKALAIEQKKIVDALEGLDPRMNRAAKKLFS